MAGRRRPVRSFSSDRAIVAAVAAAVSVASSVCRAAVTLTKTSNTNWTISNGTVTALFDPEEEQINSVQLTAGGYTSVNLLSEVGPGIRGDAFRRRLRSIRQHRGLHGDLQLAGRTQ